MCDIDNMDILFYFELLADETKEKERVAYIDEIGLF